MNCLLRLPKSILLLLISVSCSLLAIAQDITVSGKVTDKETGKPIEGVTVKVKNGTSATITNAEGIFSLRVPSSESVLTITSVGYLLYEGKAGTGTLDVSLSPSTAKLDEVIVVGYGTQRQRNITASVASVDIKKLEELPTASITEALRGQIPGLNVSGGSTRPGVNASLSIRQQFGWGKDGFSSLPLVVIDDVIQLDPNTGLPSLDQFNLLDPSEIESISVLRDASAAIYGSRASQGAIVVKTKRGKIGPPKISYSGKFEYNDAVSHIKTMNAYDYGIFANRFGRTWNWANNLFFDSSELEQMKSLSYDWRKEAWNSAGAMQHSLNVSGGSDRATYFAGGSYYTQSANLGSQDYNRWTFRTGTDVKVVNNLKLTANLSANNFSVEKSFTKVSIQDGGYGVNSEQNDYLALAHMPKYIPWMYNVNGVDTYVSPALGPNRVQTNPSGQNNITGWNYFALLNNGSKTTSGDFSYNTNFSLQYDIPFVKGLSVKGSYGLIYSSDNTEQVQLPQLLASATNTNAAGTHLYSPTTTTWNVKENTRGSRVSYSDDIGKIQQANFFVNYDHSFGLHNISAIASVEKAEQDYQKKFIIYDNPLSGGYNGASTSAGTLNTSNTYVTRSEGGSLSYLGRVSYDYSSKYLFQFLFRTDASTKFAPENYWGFFPSVSAGWIVSRENWFSDRLPWINFLKLRASVGKTGKNDIKPWKWLQLYSYAADKGFAFGQNGGTLVSGLSPDASPNRRVTWDQNIKQNYGVDFSIFRNRLSVTADRYLEHISNILTQMAGMVGVPISVGGAFAEENYSKLTTWGTELSANWKDRIGKNFEYSIGMNYGTGDNKVTKYIPVAFHYPSENVREEGYSTIFPAWGFLVWKQTSGGDGLLRTDADIDAYWAYLTDLATKAGTTPKYFDITNKDGIKKGMLAYQDLAGDLDATNKTIGGKNGQISEDQDYARLKKKNRSQGVNTNIGLSWKSLTLSAQIATSWGGYTDIDFVKQGTSSNQILWSHESYLTDMFDPLDNPNGKWPSLYYYDQNGVPSDFWEISSFRSYVRSMVIGYTLPKNIARKVRMDNLRVTLSGFNLWDFYNPYPGKYRNMYDNPSASYPTLRTLALGVNASF